MEQLLMELTKPEYSNLSKKANQGYMPATYFRKNLFTAKNRGSSILKRKKVIYDNGKLKVSVTRSLHQRHRDLLSVLFTDNKGITKPQADGSYFIKTNLYYLAQEMGYKIPKDGVHLVLEYLQDLRHTDFIIDIQGKKRGHAILGDYYYDQDSNNYMIEIPSKTAKFHILNYAIRIPKEINKKLIAIPKKYAKTKATISYIISNLPLKNGEFADTICKKLEIISTEQSLKSQSEQKSRFKKEILDNINTLSMFNISYDRNLEKFYYKQLKEIKFERNIEEENANFELDFMNDLLIEFQKDTQVNFFDIHGKNAIDILDLENSKKRVCRKNNYYTDKKGNVINLDKV